jgi:hypothetical protein
MTEGHGSTAPGAYQSNVGEEIVEVRVGASSPSVALGSWTSSISLEGTGMPETMPLGGPCGGGQLITGGNANAQLEVYDFRDDPIPLKSGTILPTASFGGVGAHTIEVSVTLLIRTGGARGTLRIASA